MVGARGGCGDDQGEHTTLPWRERRMRYLGRRRQRWWWWWCNRSGGAGYLIAMVLAAAEDRFFVWVVELSTASMHGGSSMLFACLDHRSQAARLRQPRIIAIAIIALALLPDCLAGIARARLG